VRAYVLTTGTLFGLLTGVHLVRLVAEGPHVATDPFFVIATLAAGAMCLWAVYLLRGERAAR
jgi:threonine/homoserine efflux transporter RhtA